MVINSRKDLELECPEEPIIIFANSIKNGAACVADKCVETGEWITS